MSKSMRRFALLIFCTLFCANPFTSHAQAEADIPESLKSWIPWVMHGQQNKLCPFFQGYEDVQCQWGTTLALELNDQGGTFRQNWEILAEAAVTLPGDAKVWPRNVLSNGEAIPVLSEKESPVLNLKAGTYALSGEFSWKNLPEFLTIPQDTGLVSLTLNGQEVPNPYRDENGRLWLAQRQNRTTEKDELILRVSRKLSDSVPFLMITRLDLQVAGKARESVLANPLLSGFAAYSLKSPLPARLDADGRLRLQVRPGDWSIEIASRHVGPLNEISLNQNVAPWPEDELWAFESHPDLRIVDVSGLASVDPRQTDLPEEWRSLPTYQAQPGDKLSLTQKRRGNENPEPDRLHLTRDIWLDFDGNGYSYRDDVTGLFQKSWRLEMLPGLELGRVTLNGEDQFITSVKGSGKVGIEVRQGNANLRAEGRGLRGGFTLPAVGWDHDFERVSSTLHLPPGWSVLTACGIDKISGTWFGRWTLLDLFLLFVLSLSIGKLWGARAGLLALLALALSLTEPNAPRWLWLALCVWQALILALPAGRLSRFVAFLKNATLAGFIVIVVSFALVQIHHGIYPALSQNGGYDFNVGSGYGEAEMNMPLAMPTAEPPPSPKRMMMAGKTDSDSIDEESFSQQTTSNSLVRGKLKTYAYKQMPNQQVQTGFGLPSWNWATVTFDWNGGIAANHTFKLFLMPPFANLVLAFLRVLLLIALALKIIGLPPFRTGGILKTAATACLLILTLTATNVRAAEPPALPDTGLLDELRNRLLEKPMCFPNCAEIDAMDITAPDDTLTITLTLSAAAQTAIALPGLDKDWLAEQVSLDGAENAPISRDADGFFWLKIGPGRHSVILKSRLSGKNEFKIPFQQKPRHVTADLSGWDVSGIDEEGTPEETLTLTRIEKQKDAHGRDLDADNATLPPLVAVERNITFGLTWEVETTVRRLSATGQPIVLEIPLLPGESVLTDNTGDLKGIFRANLGPQTEAVSWRSALPITEELTLTAADTGSWTEQWDLDVTPLWHVAFTGIPPIHPAQSDALGHPTFNPWPGETITLNIAKPEGAPGPTLTIDKAALDVTPGLRSSQNRLELSVRTSLGGQQDVTLDELAEVQSVSVNGDAHPIRREGAKVIVPLKPGSQNVVVEWKSPRGLSAVFRTPSVKLGGGIVNTTLTVHMPYDCWVLWSQGPLLGAVVRYWSLLVLIVIVSLILGRLPVSFLKPHQWVLLFIGLTQTSIIEAGIVAVWLLALGASGMKMKTPRPLLYDLRQIALIVMSLVACGILVDGIHQGLLGFPDMQIAGYGSTASELKWYQDRAQDLMPQATILSTPLLAYHGAMLAWGLWMAFSLIKWVRQGWRNMTANGVWQPIPNIVKKG